MVKKEYVILFKEIFQNDKNNLIPAIQAVRDNGGSVTDCVKILKKEFDLPLKEADALLWETKVWEDIRDYTFKVRDDFFDAFEDLVD